MDFSNVKPTRPLDKAIYTKGDPIGIQNAILRENVQIRFVELEKNMQNID